MGVHVYLTVYLPDSLTKIPVIMNRDCSICNNLVFNLWMSCFFVVFFVKTWWERYLMFARPVVNWVTTGFMAFANVRYSSQAVKHFPAQQ